MRNIIAIVIILTAACACLQAQGVVPIATNADNVGGLSGTAIATDIANLHIATATERTARIAQDTLIGQVTGYEETARSDRDDLLGEATEYLSHAYAIHFPSNTASIYQTLQDWFDITQSPGKIESGTFTDNGDGTIAVSTGSGFFKETDSSTGKTVFANWPADASVSLTDEVLNYIYATYASGVITIDADTVVTNINGYNEIILGTVYRQATNLDILEGSVVVINPELNDYNRIVLRGIERMTGGVVAEVATSSISSTAGVYYIGQTRVETGQRNTSGADTFTYYSRLGGGSWLKSPGQHMINNESYDNGTSTTPLTVNRYGVHWVYICLEGDLYVVFGQGNYTLALAENAVAPITLPDYLDKFAILASKIIIQKAASSFISIVSAYATLFPVSSPPNHDDLGNLDYAVADHTGFASKDQMDAVYLATATERTARINQDVLIGQATGQADAASINRDVLLGQATGQEEAARKELAVSTGTVNRPITLVVGFTADCDYVGDGASDYVQVQEAVDALATAGTAGIVMLREGVFDFDSMALNNLTTSISSITIMGQGNGTILKVNGDGGLLKVDHTFCELMNLRVWVTGGAGLGGLLNVSESDFTMVNCSFDIDVNISFQAVYVTDPRCNIINCRFDSADIGYGIMLMNGDDCLVNNNIFTQTGSKEGIVGNDGNDVMIKNNRFISASIAVDVNNANATRWQIQGNKFYGCTADIQDGGTDTRARSNTGISGDWLADDVTKSTGAVVTNTANIATNVSDIDDIKVSSGINTAAQDTPTTGDMLQYDGSQWVAEPKGTDGQVWTMGPSSATWETAAGGGGGNLNRDVFIPASQFYTQGFANYCQIKLESFEDTYDSITSTVGAYFIVHDDTYDYDFADAQYGITKQWNDAAMIIEYDFTTNGVGSGSNWFHLGVSTAQGTADFYTIYETTVGAITTKSLMDRQSATFYVTTPVADGVPLYFRIGDMADDTSTNDIYGIGLRIPVVVD